MYKKILVANRGIVALNIIRTCKEMGIKTCAVYSKPDENSLYVKSADEAYCIGSSPRTNYIDHQKIIDIAQKISADAIHPGYGFLAEDTRFIEKIENLGIKFIGPSFHNIKLFTDKYMSKKFVKDLNISVVPFSEFVSSAENAVKEAKKIGFPIIIKPVHGNHSRFFSIIKNKKELYEKFEIIASKIALFTANDKIYIEKYIDNAKHIEIPFIVNSKEKIKILPERDCSLQRRFQKLMAVSPADCKKGIIDALNKNTENIVKNSNYIGIGTVEFLVKGKEIYFLELNSSIQVEDSLTSKITGLNLIRKQIEISSKDDNDILEEFIPNGHFGYLCRINAEDPTNNFSPSSGQIQNYSMSGGIGITIENSLHSNAYITTHYDSHIATVIANGKDKQTALNRFKYILDEISIKGINTTHAFVRNIINCKFFFENDITTDLIEYRLVGKKFRCVYNMEEIACIVASVAFQYENKKHQIVPRYIRKNNNSLWNIAGRMNFLNLRKRDL